MIKTIISTFQMIQIPDSLLGGGGSDQFYNWTLFYFKVNQ
jgi:hypothetical protein